MEFVKKLWSNRSGYGVIELMIIIAILGGIAFVVGSAFKTKSETTADDIGNKISNYIDGWEEN